MIMRKLIDLVGCFGVEGGQRLVLTFTTRLVSFGG